MKNAIAEHKKSLLEGLSIEDLRHEYKNLTGSESKDSKLYRLRKKVALLQADRDMETFLAPLELPKDKSIDDNPIEYRGEMVSFYVPHGCSRARGSQYACETVAVSNKEIKEIFGFRVVKGKVYPQSNCKKCRSMYSKKKTSGKRRYREWKKRRDVEKGYILED